MKIQGKRFAAIASALALVINGLLGAQPASAALTMPTWNSGGEPTGSISGSILTVSSLPSVNTSANHGTAFPRVFACQTAVASAGFVSWAAPVGQPLMPTSGARSDCVEIGALTGTGSFSISGGSVSGSPYNPATHGVEIVIGARFNDNNGTGGDNSDDANWLAYGVSMTYVPPAPVTAASASLDATGRVVTVTMSEGITGTAMQIFQLSVDGNLKAPSVASIMPGATTVTLNLTAQDAVSAGAVVTLAYQGGAGGNQRLRSHANAAAQLANFSGMSVTNNSAVGGGSSPSQVVTTPYTGPIVQAPGAVKPVASGSKLVLDGSNLTGVSKVTIDGKDASGKLNSEGKLEITVPKGLASGTYDLVITSDSGLLTVQDAIRVSGSTVSGEEPTPSTRLKEDDTVKVYVFNVVGAGKVQIMHNGIEVAWINTDDPDDAKILNDYLVRTLELLNGKNIIEIYVNGVRIDRKAYTKVSDEDSSSRI